MGKTRGEFRRNGWRSSKRSPGAVSPPGQNSKDKRTRNFHFHFARHEGGGIPIPRPFASATSLFRKKSEGREETAECRETIKAGAQQTHIIRAVVSGLWFFYFAEGLTRPGFLN
jgi:hypothetical protein